MFDSYVPRYGADSGLKIGNYPTGSYVGFGQSFTASQTGTVTDASFIIKKVGSPSGDVKVYLYETTFDGAKYVITPGYIAESDTISASTLSTTLATTTFSFSGANQVELTSGNTYAAAVFYWRDSSSNYVEIAYDFSTITHPGNEVSITYISSYSYGAYTGYDIPFSVNSTDGSGNPVSLATVSDIVFFE